MIAGELICACVCVREGERRDERGEREKMIREDGETER